jgi:hypothetical protein
MDTLAPKRQRLLNTDTDDPMRMKFLKLRLDPRLRKSSTVKELPIRTAPYTDIDEPMRPQHLTEKALPTHIESKVLNEDDMRTMP